MVDILLPHRLDGTVFILLFDSGNVAFMFDLSGGQVHSYVG